MTLEVNVTVLRDMMMTTMIIVIIKNQLLRIY